MNRHAPDSRPIGGDDLHGQTPLGLERHCALTLVSRMEVEGLPDVARCLDGQRRDLLGSDAR